MLFKHTANLVSLKTTIGKIYEPRLFSRGWLISCFFFLSFFFYVFYRVSLCSVFYVCTLIWDALPEINLTMMMMIMMIMIAVITSDQ